MRTRNHDWFDTERGKSLYSFQVFFHGKWRHAAEDNKPCIFKTPQERDAKRKEFRALKTGCKIAMPRDAYDTLNDENARLRAEVERLREELRVARECLIDMCTAHTAEASRAEAAETTIANVFPHVQTAAFTSNPQTMGESVLAAFAALNAKGNEGNGT